MYSVANRANAVSCFGFLVLFIALGLNALSRPLLMRTEPKVSISLNEIEEFTKSPYGGNDQVIFTFDLDADLRPLFNWNVKQLFLHTVCEFRTSLNVRNEVVVWDRIVASKAESDLDLRGETVEYELADQGNELRNAEVKCALHVDISPIAGLLLRKQYGSAAQFTLPSSYTSN